MKSVPTPLQQFQQRLKALLDWEQMVMKLDMNTVKVFH